MSMKIHAQHGRPGLRRMRRSVDGKKKEEERTNGGLERPVLGKGSVY